MSPLDIDAIEPGLQPGTDPGSSRSELPDRSDFAEFPSSWYLFGLSSELLRGPCTKSILDRQIVAYRTSGGLVVVMDGRCSHLGADLGRGKMVGDSIVCPFHGWRYDPDGRCSHIPRTKVIPPQARQRVYPAVERHGLVFFFNGPEPLFPLPFVFDEPAKDFVAAVPVEFIADCTWYMVAAHGYDAQHFETVHGRKLRGPLQVDCPVPFARRSRYTADVLGNAYYDRLLRWFAGRTVDISITTWGGTIVMISGRFENASSRFMIALRPMREGRTLCQVVAFAPRAGNRVARLLLQPMSLRVRRFLTGAYLLAESKSLGSPQYNPRNLVETDREMVEYFKWAAALPRSRQSTGVSSQ